MNRIGKLLLAGAVLLPAPAMAQTLAPPATVTAPAKPMTEDETLAEFGDRAPDIETSAGDNGDGIAPSSLSAVASSGDSDVTLTISGKPSTVGRAGFFYPSLTLSAPIDDGEDDGGLLTQDGWPNKFSAKVSLSFVIFDTSLPSEATQIEMVNLSRLYRTRCIGDLEGTPEFRQANPTEQDKLRISTCDDGTTLLSRPREKLKAYLGADYYRLPGIVDELIAKKDLWLINIAGSVGHRKFAYLDPANFDERSSTKTPFSFSISVGFQSGRDAPFFGAGYEYDDSYKAGKQQVVCLPVAVGAASKCKSEIFDAPKPERTQTAFGFVRFGHLFSGRDDYGMLKPGPVLTLRVGYDFENDRLSVKAPLYFLLDKDGEFKGGVRFEWEQNSGKHGEDEGRFSLFITKSFGFLDF